MPAPRHGLGEEVLAGYLDEARTRMTARAEPADGSDLALPEEFERLRWFLLPDTCLDQTYRAARNAAAT